MEECKHKWVAAIIQQPLGRDEIDAYCVCELCAEREVFTESLHRPVDLLPFKVDKDTIFEKVEYGVAPEDATYKE